MSIQKYSRCKGCGAQVIWTLTTAGKWMICDPLVIFFTPGGGPETFVTPEGKVERGKRSKIGQFGYVPHWATCPERDRFKKKPARNQG